MKKLFLLFLTMLIVFGCQKDDNILEGLNQSVKQEFSLKGPKVKADIVVSPSGFTDGITDADNIEAALGSVPPGGTILLEKGTFFINRTIEAPAGFNGTLRGVGKDDTVIIGVGSNTSPFLNGDINWAGGTTPNLIKGGAFFFFLNPNGKVSVSNLSASISDGFETEVNTLGGRLLGTFVQVQLGNFQSDTHFENLKLTGTNTDPTADAWIIYQPVSAIEIFGNTSNFPILSSGGSHTVTNSEMTKIGVHTTVHQYFKDANIELTNNSFTANKSITSRFLDGCDVLIDNNYFEATSFSTIAIFPPYYPIIGSPNSVVIRNNTVNSAGTTCIEIGHSVGPGYVNFNVVIENNKLINEGIDPLGFPKRNTIFIGRFNDGAEVRNNTIQGTPEYGITQHSNNGLFQNNNSQGLTPGYYDYRLLGDYNTVKVKGSGNASVLDEGIGNIIKKK